MATTLALALVASVTTGWVALTAQSAAADPSPIAPRSSTMMTADALPTAQIDGVVWSQAIVGNTVYVGGSFTVARPAGSAAGVNTVPRANLMAYNLSTGVMTSWNPGTNGVVKSVTASPDGTRIYVAGNFTTAGGANRYRIAAFDTASGSLISTFAPILSTQANTVIATNSTVYVGGLFTSANGNTRNRVAAFSATNGALLPWNPNADFNVNAMVISPVGNKVILGGAFQNVGGAPAYGLAAVDDTSGALLPWNATTDPTSAVLDAGTQAAIESLTTDGTAIYGTGYVYGSGGNLEGTFSADPATGNINWIEDCHGDTYGAYVTGGVVYTVSHAHYCGNIGGFPQSNPWSINQRHALAFTTNATGTIGHDPLGYHDWYGSKSPSLINWFPDFYTGTVTGQGQAAWTVTGNSQYVIMGGEFPGVNGGAQQGLVRFAVRSIAPNLQKPRLSGASFVPSLVSLSGGTVRVAFQGNWDRDDKTLTYKVIRDGKTATPVYTVTADSEYWNLPSLGFTDTGLVPGSTHTYQLVATDPDGNSASGTATSVTVSSDTSAPSAYATDVSADGAQHFWRLGETSGTTGYDYTGYQDLTENAGVGHSGPGSGAIAGDNNGSSTFDGSSSGFAVDPTPLTGPNTFTEEAWFKTTSTSGGKIVSFGDQPTGNSSNYDRHIYMSPDGHVWFGVYNNGSYTVNTNTAYNDGAWHHVVGTMSSSGVVLYVDGKKIGSNTGTSVAQPYTGYWRIGGDSAWNGNPYFQGSIDDVAIYPTALTLAQVQKHYSDAGGSLPVGSTAPADKYGKTVWSDTPTAYYRMASAGTTETDVSGSTNDATYYGGETKGVSSPVTGTGGTAVTFDGNEGSVMVSGPVSNPTTYSEELWFNTTTTNGGKLIGFGNSSNGSRSSSYDRHVYMETSGQLTFGVYTGALVTTTSPNSYNDGKWHYLVATQGADGMKLWVDDQLVGTNPETTAQNYNGYWRVGGDTTWNGTSYFAGTIDEVALYDKALSAAQIQAHWNAAATVNQAPTASFTLSQNNLAISTDGTASSDPDGTVASYAWNFGDGQTATGVTANHTYAAAGTYQVSLTVTDNGGATNTTTQSVTVQAANIPPTAAFTSSVSNLSASFDGTGSTDPDGTIASYSWNYGDATSGAGATTTHAYAAAGTYHVVLTVTDNRGGISQVTHDVTVTAPNQAPTAAFTSSVTKLGASFDGTGSTDADGTVASYAWDFGDGQTGTGSTTTHTYATGGTYVVTLTVTDNQGATGTVSHTVTVVANQPPVAAFTTSATSLAVTADASGSSDPDGTIASYAWTFGDNSTATGITAQHTYAAAGTYTIGLTVTDDSGASTTVTHSVTVAAANKPPVASFTQTANGLTVGFDGSGSTDPDGTIASYAWAFGDGATSASATPSHTYGGSGTYQVTLTVTDNNGATTSVTKPVTVTAPANIAPTAAFTATPSNLVVAFDGSTSKDTDGTIAAYDWNFGDGTAHATSVNPSHTYATAGSYQVTLTVTDNGGLTNSVTKTVVVTAPGVTTYATDTFSRTSASGWGTADQGGAWALSTTASLYAVDGSTGSMQLKTAASGPMAMLNSVSQANVNIAVDTSISAAATGGGAYVNLLARHVGTSDYRIKERFVAGGTIQLIISKVVSGTETTLKTVNITGVTYVPGDVYRLRGVVSGSGTTTITGKLWKVGTTEPATAQVTVTDTEPTLQGAGTLGIQSYLSGTATSFPVVARYDNLSVTAP